MPHVTQIDNSAVMPMAFFLLLVSYQSCTGLSVFHDFNRCIRPMLGCVGVRKYRPRCVVFSCSQHEQFILGLGLSHCTCTFVDVPVFLNMDVQIPKHLVIPLVLWLCSQNTLLPNSESFTRSSAKAWAEPFAGIV